MKKNKYQAYEVESINRVMMCGSIEEVKSERLILHEPPLDSLNQESVKVK
jgi:hypothetical protein